MVFFRYLLLIAGCSSLFAQSITVQQLEEDIARVRKELMAVQNERQQVKKDIQADRKEQQSYLERTKLRFQKLKSETDSVKVSISRKEKDRDSINATLKLAEAKKKNFGLRQDEFRKKLLQECDTWLSTARTLPPMNRRGLEASISFLRNDVSGVNVDNVEGVNRLIQIVRDIYEVGTSVQIMPEQQTVGGLRGTCPGIRVGSFFEAAIDEKGEKAVFWNGTKADKTTSWKTEADRDVAASIRKAISVREGKALPGFVDLPLVVKSEQEGK